MTSPWPVMSSQSPWTLLTVWPLVRAAAKVLANIKCAPVLRLQPSKLPLPSHGLANSFKVVPIGRTELIVWCLKAILAVGDPHDSKFDKATQAGPGELCGNVVDLGDPLQREEPVRTPVLRACQGRFVLGDEVHVLGRKGPRAQGGENRPAVTVPAAPKVGVVARVEDVRAWASRSEADLGTTALDRFVVDDSEGGPQGTQEPRDR